MKISEPDEGKAFTDKNPRKNALPTWPKLLTRKFQKKMKRGVKMYRKNQKRKSKTSQSLIGKGPSYAEVTKKVNLLNNSVKSTKLHNEEEIRFILSKKLKLPLEMINECLSYGEYLNDYVSNALAKTKTDKRFFELAQRVKRNLVKIYRHEKLTEQKINSKISKVVEQMHKEYRETGKVNTKDWQRFLESEDNTLNRADRSAQKKRKIKKQQIFTYWSGIEEPHIIQAVDVDHINKELKEVSRELRKINVSEGTNLRHKAVKIKKIILCLAKVHNNVLELDRIEVSTEQREAA